ncbi:hypothetical protein PIB30_107190, partial [Stylosanthes scabra]|nr:hypothetical protein [Stylosanthes scabra]
MNDAHASRRPRICVQGNVARRSVRVNEQGKARICVGSAHMRGMPRHSGLGIPRLDDV